MAFVVGMVTFAMTDHSPSEQEFEELESVILSEDLTSLGNQTPAGAKGVVVHVYPSRKIYEVEFFAPKPCVLTLTASQITKTKS